MSVRKILVLRLVNKRLAHLVWNHYSYWRAQYLRAFTSKEVDRSPYDPSLVVLRKCPFGWGSIRDKKGDLWFLRGLPNHERKSVSKQVRDWITNEVEPGEQKWFLHFARKALVLQIQDACSLCKSR